MAFPVTSPGPELRLPPSELGIIGDGPAMREVLRATRQVAASRSCVLIVGETGTGKELVARAIHRWSPMHTGPYIRVNCGALSESLLESELFGHVKGAFTSAHENRTGRFEAADHGSIFLDEINSTALKLQVKLLRVLQEGEFERVGDTKTIKVETRVIAATNRDLQEEIAEGRFREDLFYRLNVVPIEIPPLRERPEDIEPLVRHFLKRFAEQERKPVRVPHPETLRLLAAHDWPGNVRELQNYVERAMVLHDHDRFLPEHLPPALRGEAPPRPPRTRLGHGHAGPNASDPRNRDRAAAAAGPAAPSFDEMVADLVRRGLREAGPRRDALHRWIVGRVENELIRQVMIACDHVQIKAAERLGMNRNTLHKKLAEASPRRSESDLDQESESDIESRADPDQAPARAESPLSPANP